MSFLARFFTAVGLFRKKVNCLVVGLDNSGKTTIIHWLKPNTADKEQPSQILPTIGFNVDQFSRGKLQFTVFDMSGQGRYRNLWEHYYPDAEAIIFVLDCSDRVRMSVARDELDTLLEHASLKDRPLPILFFANKMDLENVLTAAECSSVLGLERMRDKPWTICACSALKGEGMNVGLDWLAEQLSK